MSTAAREVVTLNKTEFTQFVEQYERLVYTICFQFTREAHTAQDLTQDTFLSAYLHINTCPKGYERQWLGRIAANKCKDHLQSAWQRRVDLPGDEGMPPGLSPPAEAGALERLQAADAKAAIEAFPEPYGPVLRRCLLEERSVEEAALALGRPVKTEYTQLNRGKKLLRQQLERRKRHV